MNQIQYKVTKHYKDSEGFYDCKTLFKGEQEECIKYMIDNKLKSTKKVQYVLKGYQIIKITKDDIEEYDRIHEAMWNDKINDKSEF